MNIGYSIVKDKKCEICKNTEKRVIEFEVYAYLCWICDKCIKHIYEVDLNERNNSG